MGRCHATRYLTARRQRAGILKMAGSKTARTGKGITVQRPADADRASCRVGPPAWTYSGRRPEAPLPWRGGSVGRLAGLTASTLRTAGSSLNLLARRLDRERNRAGVTRSTSGGECSALLPTPTLVLPSNEPRHMNCLRWGRHRPPLRCYPSGTDCPARRSETRPPDHPAGPSAAECGRQSPDPRGGLVCEETPRLYRSFAPTQKQHKSGCGRAPNTCATRTKRHSPAHVGTPARLLPQAPDRPVCRSIGLSSA